MDKVEHAAKLRRAIGARGFNRAVVADFVGCTERTVTNWTTEKTLPSDEQRAKLRTLLGPYDDPGDPVEVAIGQSELTRDRQLDVAGYYLRRLREQREARTG